MSRIMHIVTARIQLQDDQIEYLSFSDEFSFWISFEIINQYVMFFQKINILCLPSDVFLLSGDFS